MDDEKAEIEDALHRLVPGDNKNVLVVHAMVFGDYEIGFGVGVWCLVIARWCLLMVFGDHDMVFGHYEVVRAW